MGILQMHIDLDLALQKLNSFAIGSVEPAEKDYALNKAMMRFIHSRLYPLGNKYRKGFEDTEKRLQDLEPLKETVELTPVIVDSSRLLVPLPADFLFNCEMEADVFYNCGTIEFDSTSTTEYVTRLPYKISHLYQNSSVTTFTEFDIQDNGSLSILSTNFKNTRAYYGFPQDFSNFVTDAVSDVNSGSSDYTAYWERYKDLYVPGNILLVSAADEGNATIVYKTTGGTVSSTAAAASYSTQSPDTEAYDGTTTRFPIRISQGDKTARLNRNPFRKTKFSSPLAEVSGNQITLYRDSDFTIPTVYLQYIRQPRTLSYSLGQDSELSSHTDQEIIDLAVSHLLESLQSPRVQTHGIDLLKQE